jgi:hypothetical protein
MMVGVVRAERQRQAVTINNFNIFRDYTTLRRANLRAAALDRGRNSIL